MCELMGLSFAEPVAIGFSIRAFGDRDVENADGWGLGWYPDQSLAVVKEPLRWGESPHAEFLECSPDVRAAIAIAHVRHKTVGGPATRADTHPFARELGGREYAFAHNGTLQGPVWDLPLGRFRPLGTTDSEQVFCHLLSEIEGRGAGLDDEEGWCWLHARLAELNELGKLNVLLSDGVRLFAYHDAGGWKGLTVRKVHLAEQGARHFEDPLVELNLAGEAEASRRGCLVATCPLSPHGWHPFRTGELIVFEAGAICYSSHRGGHPAESVLAASE